MPGHSLGVWFPTDFLQAGAAQEFAVGLEGLGYSTLWIPETTGRDPFAHSAHLFSATSELEIATGIASIYHRHPGVMAQCAKTLAEQSQGRFVLGLGVSHAHRVTELRGLEYGKPVATMRDYLTALRAAPYTARAPETEFKTVIAALGPRMLELAAEVVDGAHTYWCTPEHTALASKILGPGKELCVEQKIVLCEDPELARKTARKTLAHYIQLPNYRNTWLRLGFTEEDLADGGNDRLIDALVAWGDEGAIRDRIEAHRRAGATHVCIQPLKAGGRVSDIDWNVLELLAPNSTVNKA